jgi:hypothetical protein
MTKALSTKDLQLISDELRIQDVRIGERLGFDRPRKIRELIERNKEELETYGALAPHGGAQLRENGATIVVDEFWLNEPQTLLLCMFSRTEKAAEVRREVISVYMAHRQGQKILSAPERQELDCARAKIADLQEKVALQKELIAAKERIYINDQSKTLFDAVIMLIKGGCISDEDIAKSIGLDIEQIKFARFKAECV